MKNRFGTYFFYQRTGVCHEALNRPYRLIVTRYDVASILGKPWDAFCALDSSVGLHLPVRSTVCNRAAPLAGFRSKLCDLPPNGLRENVLISRPLLAVLRRAGQSRTNEGKAHRFCFCPDKC